MHRERGRILDESQTVFIKKSGDINQLYRNGKPFYIMGASGSSYLKELYQAGGNTLRVYDTLNLKSLLDEAAKYDLAVIVDIYLPSRHGGESYYTDSENIRELKQRVRRVVHSYKNHSSLLIWNLGNEINYPLDILKNPFVNVFNELVDIIHEEDPNHLVSTSISGTSRAQTLGIHLNSPQLDLIGFNSFGSLPQVRPLMSMISIFTNAKPYYIMEWGNHGPWEAPINLWKSNIEPNSTLKGAIYKDIYEENIKSDTHCLGSLAFYWGHKEEGTPTWFNIFDEMGRKSEVYYTLQSLWSGEKEKSNEIPKIAKMLLMSSEEINQIVEPNQIMDSQVYLANSIDSTYTFNWKVYKEAWGHQHWAEELESFQISNSTGIFSNELKFKVPNQDGPYRIFVSVNDAKGNFATANVPFYVLSAK